MKSVHFNVAQISGLSSANMKLLADRMVPLGLSVAVTENRYNVTGPKLSGTLIHDQPTETLTIELHEVPDEVTPGHIVGRLYDEILSICES